MLSHDYLKWMDKTAWRNVLEVEGEQPVLDTVKDIFDRSNQNAAGQILLSVALSSFAEPHDVKGNSLLSAWCAQHPKIYFTALLSLIESTRTENGVEIDTAPAVEIASEILPLPLATLLVKHWATLKAKVPCPDLLKARAQAFNLTEATAPLAEERAAPRPHRF